MSRDAPDSQFDDYLSDRRPLIDREDDAVRSTRARRVTYEDLESEDEYNQRPRGTAVGGSDRKAELSCCGRIKDRMRQYYLYHLISFCSHYLGFLIAIAATASTIAHSNTVSVSTGIGIFAVVSVIVDLYLLNHHYKAETYFPYCAAPHLLFMTKNGMRVDPGPPPNETVYFTDKVLIFWQGYIFVVIPYTNLAAALDRRRGAMSTWDKILLALILVQLAITIFAWVLFILFYLVFTFEILIRFFCFFCCLYRPRKNTQPVPTDEHIFASHSSDPIFYAPYEFLYENM
jgi:hypothetical protein